MLFLMWGELFSSSQLNIRKKRHTLFALCKGLWLQPSSLTHLPAITPNGLIHLSVAQTVIWCICSL